MLSLHQSFALAVAVGAAVGATPALAQNTSSLTHSVVIEGLENPWDMAFLGDGTMLFTEKCKGLSVRMPDGSVNALLGMGGVEGYNSAEEDLFCEGQAGMMGVAFDPNFDENRRIYVYATSNMSDPHTNRLMRFVVNEDFSGVSERTDIVDDVPYKMAASDHPFGGPGAAGLAAARRVRRALRRKYFTYSACFHHFDANHARQRFREAFFTDWGSEWGHRPVQSQRL